MAENETVAAEPITIMNRLLHLGKDADVVSVFGKSIYVKRYLSVEAVVNSKFLNNAMPDVWTIVDATTLDILSRAVIMH